MLSRVGRGRGGPSCTNTKTEQHVKHSGRGRGGPSYTIRGQSSMLSKAGREQRKSQLHN